MTDAEALRSYDDTAFRLCSGYAKRQTIAFVVRLMEDGQVRIIGPSIPADCVVDLFTRAMTGYVDSQAEDAGDLH
jgi:hypothetical protein